MGDKQINIFYMSTTTLNSFSSFTERENQIAMLILEGKKTNDIANKLNVKSNTISTLKKRIFEKAGVESSIQLYKLAISEGIIIA
jgi:DNA-binding NarL/FixJ family response regulator